MIPQIVNTLVDRIVALDARLEKDRASLNAQVVRLTGDLASSEQLADRLGDEVNVLAEKLGAAERSVAELRRLGQEKPTRDDLLNLLAAIDGHLKAAAPVPPDLVKRIDKALEDYIPF